MTPGQGENKEHNRIGPIAKDSSARIGTIASRPLPSKGTPISDPEQLTRILFLILLVVLVGAIPVTAFMGVRWNRRHGFTQQPAEAANEDRNWWMLPERRQEANRLLRRGEVAHDPETAYNVCAVARMQMVRLRNPWFYVTWATVVVGLQLLNIGGQLSFRASGQASLIWGIIVVVGCVALLAVVFAVRSRQLKAARSAFERNRLVAGDDKEMPLPPKEES